MKKMDTILNIFIVVFVICAFANSLSAQDNFVSRYVKVDTTSNPKLPIKIKSAEVERLKHDSLLTVSMLSQRNRIVKKIHLQLQVFDKVGKLKRQEEWTRRVDLFGGNNAEMDLVLKGDVRSEDHLILKLVNAK